MHRELKEVEVALTSVQEALRGSGMDDCDASDVQDLIDRVESEMEYTRPNAQVIGTFLNSIAKSLRTHPNARDACSRIDEALHRVGVARTWMN